MAAEHVTPEDRLQYFVNVDKANRPLADQIPGGYQDAPLRRSDLEVVLATEESALAIVERLQAELAVARSLRLDRPSQGVDPAVHTPARVLAYLRALGWVREGGAEIAELWRDPESGQRVTVSLHPDASDYAKVLGFLAKDLADLRGTGELRILSEIAEGGDA